MAPPKAQQRVWMVSAVFGDVPSNGWVVGGAWIAPLPELATAQFVAHCYANQPKLAGFPLNGIAINELPEDAIRHFVSVFEANAAADKIETGKIVSLVPAWSPPPADPPDPTAGPPQNETPA